MTDFKVGDEVRVLKSRSRYDQFPAEGRPGKVIKVGRKYATAAYTEHSEYSGRDYDRTIEFDMETGSERGTVTSYGYYIRTPEMLERDRRMSAARAAIKEAGLEFRMGRERKFTLEQLEALAEVVKTFDA